ncbi:MAG: 8-amino-7-oxononanoate synthase [Halobacteria archaeon]
MKGLGFLSRELRELEARGLRRKMRLLSSAPGPRAVVDGREVLVLCSNDYLGLAAHPGVARAAVAAVAEWGTGATASRLIAGNLEPHLRLEEAAARFLRTESALLFPTGTQANLGALTALAGPGTVVFSDALNHASVIDGIRLSGAERRIYPHRDAAALEALLRKSRRAPRRLIASDSLFSMDGDLADLPRLLELAEEHDALLYLDEAHALGTLGPGGRGALEHFRIRPRDHADRLVVMAGLGKAMGSAGGVVAGSRELADYLANRARGFVFSTGPPPPVAAAGREALRISASDEGVRLRRRLRRNGEVWKRGLEGAGADTRPSETHIVPVSVGDARRAVALSRRLLRGGLFIQAIRPPSVPPGTSRLRSAPTAAHSGADIEEALELFEAAWTGSQSP